MLHSVDIDPLATACAHANGAGTVHLGELFGPLPAALRGAVDVIVAVTPYVPSDALDLLHREARLYEPAATHDGGPDGLVLVRTLLAEAGDWLAPGGAVLLEVSEAQGPVALECAAGHGFAARVERDDELDATVIVAVNRRLG